MARAKRVYFFGEGKTDFPLKNIDTSESILGGKGKGLVSMTADGLPVPPGFTITTGQCRKYLTSPSDRDATMVNLKKPVKDALAKLTKIMGYTPLLSIRSGARVSMPGMMDTILNIGITLNNLTDWEERIGERAALDSYRRLIQMYSSVVAGVPSSMFEKVLKISRTKAGVSADAELACEDLLDILSTFREIYHQHTKTTFPDTVEDQVQGAIAAVFSSWGNERAQTYRKLNNIPETWGTACTVQAMVFGNMNGQSGSGVCFTRDPNTGEPTVYGEFLLNAQGEDVVAGIRTPITIIEIDKHIPGHSIFSKIMKMSATLESKYRDMQDFEFTVQDGEFWILQTRAGKRSAKAAFRIAVEMVGEGLITKSAALQRVEPKQWLLAQVPYVSEGFSTKADAVGIPACPGVVTGKIVYTSAAAVKATEPVVLVTDETNPDDIAGMKAAVGILTFTGGKTSHAAVVARSMDTPCVVGCEVLSDTGTHDTVTIDGSTGEVWFDTNVPIEDSSQDPITNTFMRWVYTEVNALPISGNLTYTNMVLAACEWGNTLKIIEMLNKLSEADCKGIILDITPPSVYKKPSDSTLWGLSIDPGVDEKAWDQELKAKLIHRVKSLDGLVIMSNDPTHGSLDVLKDSGFTVVSDAKTVADLASGNPVVITQNFITNIAGSQEIADKLLEFFGNSVATLPVTLTEIEALQKVRE